MEKLLKKYLREKHNWNYIDIDHYNIDGAICAVKYYTDKTRSYSKKENINIWDMLVFTNKR